MKGTGILLMLAIPWTPGFAQAFTIQSSFSSNCHERISRNAVEASNVTKPASWVRRWPDQDETWVKLARWLEYIGFIEPKDDRYRMLQVSLFVGARYPDQRGFGITDLQGLREIHLSENGQEEHALRAPEHDDADGDRLAIEATRAYILDLVRQSRRPDQWNTATQMKEVRVWLEFYGSVDVAVFEPAFLMGRALHALQDSFAHTYRSPDLRRIYAVGNYLEAIAGDYDEARDGPRHSKFLDECDEPEIAPLEAAATQASTELFNAVLGFLDTDDLAPVERVLDDWLRLDPACGYRARYCDTPWAALARRDETKPLLGCSFGHGPVTGPVTLALAIALTASLRHRRSTKRRKRGPGSPTGDQERDHGCDDEGDSTRETAAAGHPEASTSRR